jgi:hypothetical protein
MRDSCVSDAAAIKRQAAAQRTAYKVLNGIWVDV